MPASKPHQKPTPGKRGTRPQETEGARADSTNRPWYRSTFVLGATSGLLLWLAFPPAGLWPLAWIAPLFWVVLIREPRLSGRHPYLTLWAVGCLHWLVLYQFIRLPHWAAALFGWPALAIYLGAFLPVFVGLARVAVHGLRLPVVLAAPIVWTGLELARGHLVSGFSASLLGHTQVPWAAGIQIADLCGAYTVSFAVMFVAACLACLVPMIPKASGRKNLEWWPIPAALVVVIAIVIYGQFRLNETTAPDDRVVRVALIQESVDTVFEYDPKRDVETFRKYLDLTLEAVDQHPDLDLIVWPETKFTGVEPDFVTDGPIAPPLPEYGIASDKYDEQIAARQRLFADKARFVAEAVNPTFRETGLDRTATYLLVGTETARFGPHAPEFFNSALLISPSGAINGRYFKMHRAPFGEYIPLGDFLPWLYYLTPMSDGLTPGRDPEVFEVAGMRLAPNICFESTVPHLVRSQISRLASEGRSPDILVNITDDGWFWGSSCLDHHLACSVMRAVENRRPVLVAANTGFSAWIDGNGVIRAKGPRRDKGIVYAEARPDGRATLYQFVGDWPAAACLILCGVFAVTGGAQSFKLHFSRRIAVPR